MTSETMRSFAIGLLVSASLCGAVFFLDSNEASTQTKEILSDEEMKNKLASKGYVIQTEEEWQKQIDATEPVEKKGTDENTIVYRTILTVSQGMTSIDVGKALEKAHIIESSKAFFNEVEKRGVSTKLRPGSYEVESGMTTEEIIATIFKI